MCEAVMLGTAAVAATETAPAVAATSGLIGTGGMVSPWFTIGTSVAGLGLSAVGAVQQTEAANAAADAQSKIAANNAQIAENEARYAEGVADKNAQVKRRQTAQLIGTQRAAMGASGAVVDEGSFMDITLDTAQQGELDAMALLDEGDRAAWRARSNADNFSAQSSIYANSKASPLASVTGSLLQGAGQIGSNWYRMTKKS